MAEPAGNRQSQEKLPGRDLRRRFWLRIVLIFAVLGSVGAFAFYYYITHGGLIARQKPPALEVFVANGIVNLSIPKTFKDLKNPLGETNDAAIAAGHDLYQKNCQTCHGYDGAGKTAAVLGLYPPPADLSRNALLERRRTDGELFYFIRNGIRNTAMPGWQLPDQQTWQLVSYLRALPLIASLEPPATANCGPSLASAHFVGSAACQKCHPEIYEHWKKTPMANVVRDPREHPDVIIPDLSKPDPVANFTTNDIAFVYGSIWKQRYFKKVGDDYFALPAQWDVTHKSWKRYFVKDDWWAPLYPPDNFKRPTGPLCDGCHSVTVLVWIL